MHVRVTPDLVSRLVDLAYLRGIMVRPVAGERCGSDHGETCLDAVVRVQSQEAIRVLELLHTPVLDPTRQARTIATPLGVIIPEKDCCWSHMFPSVL